MGQIEWFDEQVRRMGAGMANPPGFLLTATAKAGRYRPHLRPRASASCASKPTGSEPRIRRP